MAGLVMAGLVMAGLVMASLVMAGAKVLTGPTQVGNVPVGTTVRSVANAGLRWIMLLRSAIEYMSVPGANLDS